MEKGTHGFITQDTSSEILRTIQWIQLIRISPLLYTMTARFIATVAHVSCVTFMGRFMFSY